ncbi:DUF1428 family protein [Rhodobacteraceae bacterium N5(2021)]|uniref:DUF1428 family protein n=1 Tax=Gymnodinialimonas phycosphaerae TaxID=2841589 RepID=A0A975TUV4_9RHOB|nr:DUF1428 family protein [Gymnodinialimonas phycosphaerae]MBY4891300.1 DUF1428 family protein [Gymnodinialimonas phycosphaerae]
MHIDGFLIPVKTARKDEYVTAVKQIASLYLKHGATRCVETWGPGLEPGKRTSFPRAVEAAADETVVFSWMEFPDAATSAAAHEAVWAEPEMGEVMQSDLVDGKRMVFGGFEMLLDAK